MANIHDVARVAGVSISTVSYALSGKRPIGEKTRLRIDQAVRELDYMPNAAGRMLAGTRTRIFALTAPLRSDTYTPAHMAFVLAVATAARQYDYDVLLLTEDEATDGLRRVSSSRLVDGIIVLDVSINDERADLVRALGVPAALIGVPGNAEGLVCVDLDFEAAAALAVDRLVDAGHASLALLGHPQAVYERGSNFPTRFRDGFLRRASERGVDARFSMMEKDAPDVRSALFGVLDADPAPTGLVVHAEEGVHKVVLEAIAGRGLSVPRDLSVIAGVPTFDTSGFTPPLDSIPLIPADTCTRAVELAVRQLDGTVAPRVELVAPTYREHGSVAAPRRGS
ncbi:LacI family DNA-binding transcriptional regulator [Arthrobacter agilis]|uniref:LacI family DNA-binding transcriptional regulator n=1 Tax=Arthrobacter agilis TaxID=37921 RepID=UPI002781BD1B|nr:LacI family DNA-binding transcriptional regulator [Arthrobacter agilis]MDQ0733700.1 DNA-binding LacI/PurR family transcriptional regulator [Arthrobacter agilis]